MVSSISALSWQLRVAADAQEVDVLHGVAARDAALPLEQIVEHQAPDMPVLRRVPLQVDADLELDVLPHGGDALRRLVLALQRRGPEDRELKYQPISKPWSPSPNRTRKYSSQRLKNQK